jgi:predicted nuclease of predicted toxin-antitoxin system
VRILLDENLPADLAAEFAGHEVATVTRLGWQGIKNRELLRRAQGRFDVLVTMDRNLEFQQNIAGFEVTILVLLAPSNRMVHLRPLVPAILTTLKTVRPGELRRVGA